MDGQLVMSGISEEQAEYSKKIPFLSFSFLYSSSLYKHQPFVIFSGLLITKIEGNKFNEQKKGATKQGSQEPGLLKKEVFLHE